MHTASDELSRGPVVLRRWRRGDAEDLYRAVSESIEHLAPWMAWAAHGYATAAAAALTSEAFRIGADRVEIVHDLANVASGAIPRRVGFREVDRRAPQEERTAGEVGVDVVWRLCASRSGDGMTFPA
ncbi:GNAT family N-acetyltransferase [Pseudonocardia alaniniphila]|uniref:N-acetyltransferase domain-containing protein n=1 Tax=Pseudonocardia alaniniphila TaxID=75291 RepID=A0ABS9TJ52_9PSEU|nr:GNAT family N-acetyltransferase [Pseudonocardia alaniniphila]MCH6168448.1 hypothetical protein [Pseudonocardia alaniniphila]